MTREEQTASDPRYRDWRKAYIDDVRERVKHWGDRHVNGNRRPTRVAVYEERDLDK